ncbi:MAG: type III-A CRISPR-associated RAMP protein Csm5 [Clostridia bacterium]|nr:type III-A CRISPR-associated RAMP protein Csm5 [Clostridia bacterium]
MSVKMGHLVRYRVEIRLRSPLFIGSGTKLNRMEYVNEDGNIILPDTAAMFAYLLEHKHIGAFQQEIASGKRDLINVLHEIGAQGRYMPFRWPLRTIPVAREYAQTKGNGMLQMHIATPDGRAYIPGSSIKGAIRTAMLAKMMHAGQHSSVLEALGQWSSQPWELALRVLRVEKDKPDNAVNDLLRAIQVSDSAPFAEGSTCIRRRRWVAENGSVREVGLLCECVDPGATTHFYLTIDHSIWPERLGDPLAFISACLTDWQNRLESEYNSSFVTVKPVQMSEGTVPIVLGAGTGFQQHTLVYARGGAEVREHVHNFLTRKFATYKPAAMSLRAPYCRKAVLVNGSLQPLGVCELKFT